MKKWNKKFNAEVTYDSESDAFHIKFKKGKAVKQMHFEAEGTAYFDESGDLSGIKVLDMTDSIIVSQPKFQKMIMKALKEKGGIEWKEFFKTLEKETQDRKK